VSRPRIAVVSVYFTLFDAQMPGDFRARQEDAVARQVQALAAEFDVAAFTGLLTSEEEARAANAVVREAGADVVVFAPSMAAPASYGITALEGIDAPLVLWNAPGADRLGEDLDQRSAHEHTTMLGALMLANPLARRERSFHAVSARTDRAEEMMDLCRTIRALAAGRRVRGRTVLRIGDPYPGYLNVEANAEQLAQLDLVERSISRDALEAAFDAADPEALENVHADIAARGWRGVADERGIRLAAAVSHLAGEHDVLCGTVNCHSDLVRFNDRIGVPACLAASHCGAGGTPFSCTGDLPAAIAMALGTAIAGSVLYCEFYAPEPDTDLFLVANGGEGDGGLAAGSVDVVPSSHYPGVNGAGAAVTFDLAPGPVTLMTLSPMGTTWRLVWALGELVESRYPRMLAPNAMFRFDSPGTGLALLDRWIASGASHHNALIPGHRDLELPLVAEALRIEAQRV
jgi:L-arabinose isomerase